ncbi:hypothetical protein QBC37DRAFT_401692 [Rhypophila decipiens]|uniref:Uncharacterized protein n=1 Tax=Rhypophila decipiens TaxID=261697 RepID=A0AAN6Y8W4_9PEZI|nr:hypothetical protein QBC37DRAFT_401692 [Rhypophila decipiens]
MADACAGAAYLQLVSQRSNQKDLLPIHVLPTLPEYDMPREPAQDDRESLAPLARQKTPSNRRGQQVRAQVKAFFKRDSSLELDRQDKNGGYDDKQRKSRDEREKSRIDVVLTEEANNDAPGNTTDFSSIPIPDESHEKNLFDFSNLAAPRPPTPPRTIRQSKIVPFRFLERALGTDQDERHGRQSEHQQSPYEARQSQDQQSPRPSRAEYERRQIQDPSQQSRRTFRAEQQQQPPPLPHHKLLEPKGSPSPFSSPILNPKSPKRPMSAASYRPFSFQIDRGRDRDDRQSSFDFDTHTSSTLVDNPGPIPRPSSSSPQYHNTTKLFAIDNDLSSPPLLPTTTQSQSQSQPSPHAHSHDHDSLNAENLALKSCLESSFKNQETLRTRLSSSLSRIETLSARLTTAQSQTNTAIKRAESLSSQITRLTTENSNNRVDLASWMKRHEEVELLLMKEVARSKSLKVSLEERDYEMEGYRLRCEVLEGKVRSLKGERDLLRRENEGLWGLIDFEAGVVNSRPGTGGNNNNIKTGKYRIGIGGRGRERERGRGLDNARLSDQREYRDNQHHQDLQPAQLQGRGGGHEHADQDKLEYLQPAGLQSHVGETSASENVNGLPGLSSTGMGNSNRTSLGEMIMSLRGAGSDDGAASDGGALLGLGLRGDHEHGFVLGDEDPDAEDHVEGDNNMAHEEKHEGEEDGKMGAVNIEAAKWDQVGVDKKNEDEAQFF